MRITTPFLLAFSLLIVVVSESDARVSCTYSEQNGCLEIDIVAVHKNKGSPEIQELLTSAPPGKQKVSEVLKGDIALRIYAAAEEGRVQYHSGCFIVLLRFWQVPTPPITRMSEYRMPLGKSIGVNPSPKKAANFSPTQIEAVDRATEKSLGTAVQYQLEVCGGKGALQVPWDFLPPGAMIQIEPAGVATVFPWSTKDSQRKVALWLTADQINSWRHGNRKERWEFVVVPIIFPETRD